MLNYTCGDGEMQNWVLAEESFDQEHQGKCESVMHLANGYVGIRSAFEENYPGQTRGMFVAGSFNRLPGEVVELPNAADGCAMEIGLDGERFSQSSGTVEHYSRRLNLRTGELLRELQWTSPKKRRYRLEFRRFVSWEEPQLYAQQVTIVSLDGPVVIELKTGINARVTNSGAQHFCEGTKRVLEDEVLYLTQQTSESQFWFEHACLCKADDPKVKNTFYMERRHLYQTIEGQAARQEPWIVQKFSSVEVLATAPAAEEDRMVQTVKRLQNWAGRGYKALFRASAQALARRWNQQDIRVDTDTAGLQLAIRYAQYSLMAAMPPNKESSIAAKGLSGEGYKGHVFWDTEVFMLPYFLHTCPQQARLLLEYRIVRIDQAMENASNRGYRGIMFPWESAITGQEETPRFANIDISTGAAMPVWAGEKEHHITADVAFAVWNYWRSTGDDALIQQGGALLLVGCALFWCSRATWMPEKGRFEILDVVGPDEYTEHVNNNAYTNYMAWQVGKYALAVWEMLPEDLKKEIAARLKEKNVPGILEHFCEKLYLPLPGEEGVLPQDDSFLGKKVIDITPYKQHHVKQMILKDYSRHQVDNMQVLKQADAIMLMALYPRLFSAEIQSASWDYYEPKTIHDSSLSHAVYALVACQFGQAEKAYESFLQAMQIDLGPNPCSSDLGTHTASMSGIWMDIVQGFAGLRRAGDSLSISPCLPKAIRSIELEFVFHARRYHLLVNQQGVQLDCQDSEETEVLVFGESHRFSGRLLLPLGPRAEPA